MDTAVLGSPDCFRRGNGGEGGRQKADGGIKVTDGKGPQGDLGLNVGYCKMREGGSILIVIYVNGGPQIVL